MAENTVHRRNKPGLPFICVKCKSTEFYVVHPPDRKTPRRLCKPCQILRPLPPAQLQRAKAGESLWRKAARAALIRLAGGKCAKCDYSANLAALHFHHIDPSIKSFPLTMVRLPLSSRKGRIKRLAEFHKCKLLCANCHSEETHPQYQKKTPMPKWNSYENESFAAWRL